MASKKPYFDNNWEEYYNAPAEAFIELSYEDFFDHRVANWELPSSVKCIMRISNSKTKKVEEKIYRRVADVQRKLSELIKDPDLEITLCDHNSIHHLSTPDDIMSDSEDDEDEDDWFHL